MAVAMAEKTKSKFVPKIRVEEYRDRRYRQAYKRWREQQGVSDLSYAAFVRDTLDRRAAEILG